MLSNLFQEFGIKVDQATISRTLKCSYEYLDNETNLLQNPLQKKPRNVRYPELELALQEWCLHSQNHIPLTDLIITEKAKSFAKLLNIPDDALTFSSGWLQSFKNRNNLKRYQLHGESGSADTNAIENALPDLKAIISSFRPECVYNMDETGL
nr:14352_t:CDS:2 [Entrophospora candida]